MKIFFSQILDLKSLQYKDRILFQFLLVGVGGEGVKGLSETVTKDQSIQQ